MKETQPKWTDEQLAILDSCGNIKINAVAGSGKTTTLVEYARRRSGSGRFLYLAFNRSVRLEAQRKFTAAGMERVDVQTAHSLAWRAVVAAQGFKVAANGYKVHDLVRLLNIEPLGRDPHSAWLVANHALKCAVLFCNSAAARVQELDYPATLTDDSARAFARWQQERIVREARRFLALMEHRQIDCTHDFYLKKYQLGRPVLRYDTILFDEGQDASPVMLDVFLNQRAARVIVGDVHQQIYGWRHAINALRQVDFRSCDLGTSFRFNEQVAALAMQCLAWKRHLGEEITVTIRGVGTNTKVKSRATVARTNLALLKAAIGAVTRGSLKKIYFEGNINSYTYAGDGASIYDVLNLYLGTRERVRDPLIAAQADFEQLQEYAERSDDQELRMMISIVEEYGREIPRLLKQIQSLHVPDDQRHKADMIFSTVHRCKGMEYDSVSLTDDFMTEKRLMGLVENEPVPGENGGTAMPAPVVGSCSRDRLCEEVNLAYVALTRSRNFLQFPDAMFPGVNQAQFSLASKNRRGGRRVPAAVVADTASVFLQRKRADHPRAYVPWSRDDDEELARLYAAAAKPEQMARSLGRNRGAIASRLKKLSLIDDD